MIADGPGVFPNLTRPDHNPGPGARTMATIFITIATPDSQAALAFE